MEEARLIELERLYERVDALYAGARCDASSECCRFAITGREPQVTALELALILRALKRRGGPLSKQRRALPLFAARDERTCPLLDREGRCSVYEARPLGCRTYFCSRATQFAPPPRRVLRELVHQLEDLASSYCRDGHRPRALCVSLASLDRPVGWKKVK